MPNATVGVQMCLTLFVVHGQIGQTGFVLQELLWAVPAWESGSLCKLSMAQEGVTNCSLAWVFFSGRIWGCCWWVVLFCFVSL